MGLTLRSKGLMRCYVGSVVGPSFARQRQIQVILAFSRSKLSSETCQSSIDLARLHLYTALVKCMCCNSYKKEAEAKEFKRNGCHLRGSCVAGEYASVRVRTDSGLAGIGEGLGFCCGLGMAAVGVFLKNFCNDRRRLDTPYSPVN